MSRYWYFYNPIGAGDETDPVQYTTIPALNVAGSCSSGQRLCAVYAHKNPQNGKPFAGDLSAFSTIYDYIAASRASFGVPYPTGTPFVYLKSST